MSGGTACKIPDHRPSWRVVVRNAHHSAFNGGRKTSSAYSSLTCLSCGSVWRSKAAYVDGLPNFGENP